MDIIINDRDVWLQSFATRFENATVQQGTVTTFAQNDGTVLTIFGAKKLELAATSQYFQSVNMIVEPPYITLTPTLRNLSGPPTYSVISGSATIGTSGDKAQLIFSAMGSDKVTVLATVTDGGVTYRDRMTFVKLVTGGTNITTFLTNEMHAVLADAVGNVYDYSGCSGTFRVFEGAFEITADCDFAITENPSNLLCSISSLGMYVVTGIPASVGNTTITLQATYHGTTYTETFYIDKLNQASGSAGDPAQQTATGKRLPMKFTIPIPGTTWSTVAANQAVIPYNGTVLNDEVTEYNNSAVPPYKETRFWNLIEWVRLDAKIDGNLLVTGSVSADKLSANTITAITGNFQDLITQNLAANNANIQNLITTSLTANTATISQLIADQIAAQHITADQLDVSTLRINGVNINPNQINTGHMIDNSISVNGALSGNPSAMVDGSTPYTTGTVSVTYAVPTKVVILASMNVEGMSASGSSSQSLNMLEALIDGSVNYGMAGGANVNGFASTSYSYSATVAAGTHTFGLRMTTNGQGGQYVLLGYSISVIGIMK